MIKVTDLTFSYWGKPIFNEASFVVGKNLKVGLVAPNGAGKTTLFNILIGKESPEGGKVDLVGSISLVPQEVKHDPEMENSESIREYVTGDNNFPDFEIKRMLTGVELSNLSLDESPRNLSGGQKTKLALVKALLTEPDILLLDEPTNFMDKSGKKFVMDFLNSYPKTVVLISHDLKLLDKSINKVLYINIQTKKIEEYKGNYSKFIKLREEAQNLFKKRIQTEGKRIERMKEGLRKLSGRTSGKGVRQRVMLQRRIERLEDELPELPRDLKSIKVTLPTPSRSGELPIRVLNIFKSYGELEVLKGINFSIRRGERFVIIGPNGAGKSTLIKIMIGALKPDNGEVLTDYGLKLGFYSQEFEDFDFNRRVIDFVTEKSKMEESRVRSILAKFLFDENKIRQTIGTLSGGEKTRLAISLLVLQDFNLLILDEPTTYLDPLSQRIILEALKEYEGTLIVVSHTEDFIRELKPTRALFLPENEIKLWEDELLVRVSEI